MASILYVLLFLVFSSLRYFLEKQMIYYGANGEEINTRLLLMSILVSTGLAPLGFGLIYLLKLSQEYTINNHKLNEIKLKHELDFLKIHVHPHFLFNAFNNVYSLVIRKKEGAADVILHISTIMRYFIDHAQTELITVEKELEIIDTYIKMEIIKGFKEQAIAFRIAVEEEKRAKEIPPLLLIPLVENAFKHGRDCIDPFIKILIKAEGQALVFSIANKFDPAANKEDKPAGMGLVNLKKRLELLYPTEKVLIISKNDDWYTTYLTIPLT